MPTDSSSGTFPSSSRFTIVSSSSIARSKLSCLTSAWMFSAMLPSQKNTRGTCRSSLRRSLRTDCGGNQCGRNSTAHQGRDMGCNRFLEALQIIAAFEHRDNSPGSTSVGEVHQLARHPAEIFSLEVEGGEGIAVMRIEAGGDDDELGCELLQSWKDAALECSAELRAAIFGRERRVDDGIVLAAFACRARAGKQRHLVSGAIHHASIGPEDILG